MKSILLTLLVSLACAVMYRMGGSGNYPRQVRVVGVPFLTTLLAYLLGVHSWWLLLAFVAMIGAISTYWDVIFNDWDNFWFHGFMLGVACFPIAIATGHWWLFGIRCVVLALFMGIWSYTWKWDIAEETGRGFIIPATLFMIC